MATLTRKHKYEEVGGSEMTVCNSVMVQGVFIGEVSPVKHSWTNMAVCFLRGSFQTGKKNGADGVIRGIAY